MKKTIQIIYTVIFLVLCIVPAVLMPFVNTDTSSENRKLSEMPSFTSEDGGVNLDWPSEFETYLSEHFAFRQELVTLDSLMKSEVFQTSSNDQVVVGKNGWLYFASTLDDYTAQNTLSERGINNTAKTLFLMEEYANACGREFLFMAAPNKNTVYPGNMPDRYVKSGNLTNLQMLSARLDELGVNQLALTELFASQDKVLYLSRDSHWSNEGALLVYNAVMDKLGIEHDTFADVPHHSENTWSGDLDAMLFPTLDNHCAQEIYDMDYTFNYIGNFMSEDDMLIRTINENKSARILMYRDSFGRSLYPFIAENSYKAEFSRQIPYRLDLMNDIDAEYIVLEIVERNIPAITEQAPVMAAPMRSMDISAAVRESDGNICETKELSGMLKVYGVLDESYFSDDSDIYVTLEGESGIYGFEAFPIYEAELLEDESQSDYGYSLFIDTDEIPNGDYAVNVYVESAGSYICTNSLKNIEINN